MTQNDWCAMVWSVLVEFAGANPEGLESFRFRWKPENNNTSEYRFQGWLGFGGKLYTDKRRWRVGCYREDMNHEREAMILETNTRLAELHELWLDETNDKETK